MLEAGLSRKRIDLTPVLETNSIELLRRNVLKEGVITFQTRIGAPFEDRVELDCRVIDARDVAPGRLVLGQSRGRTLPVASAKFANRLAQSMDSRRHAALAI